VTKFVGGGVTVECNNVVFTGHLDKNNKNEGAFNETAATITTADFKGTGTIEDCTSNGLGAVKFTTNVGNGVPFCLYSRSSFAADEVQMRGGSCTEANRSVTFVLDVTSLGLTCRYNRSTPFPGPLKGTYRTDTSPENSDAIVDLKTGANTEFEAEAGNPFGCPGAGSLEMSITLETDLTGTNTPIWFS